MCGGFVSGVAGMQSESSAGWFADDSEGAGKPAGYYENVKSAPD